jgi:ribosomal protein L27
MGRDHTIFATVAGKVAFRASKEDKQIVSVIPVQAAE